MKRVRITALALLLSASTGLHAAPVETADDYFNLGSATFIRENAEKALPVVAEGLVLYPDNEKLIKLKELLEQQNEQDQQQQNQQQDQQQDQDSEDSEGENDQDQQQPQEQPPENEQEDNADDQNKQEQSQDRQQAESQESPEDMSEDEANMILDSLRQLEQAQREQLTQEMIRQQSRNLPPVEKDW